MKLYRLTCFIILLLPGPLTLNLCADSGTVQSWDFSSSKHGWFGNPRIQDLGTGAEGWTFRCTGEDPWIESPVFNFPTDQMLRATIRMKSEADSSGELFYGPRFTAGESRRFMIRPDGMFHEYRMILPPIGPSARLRLDPAVGAGEITLASILIESIPILTPPELSPPSSAYFWPSRNRYSIESGRLTAEHDGRHWGGYSLTYNQSNMAVGHDREFIAAGDPLRWINLHETLFKITRLPDGWIESSRIRIDGHTLLLQRSFQTGPIPGSIDIETTLSLEKTPNHSSIPILHVPWLTLFPGLGSTGRDKHQAIFPGLEYLDNEPSSSKADIESDGYDRRVPDPIKITWPMMGIVQSNGSFLSLMWENSPDAAAIFDSPDRVFGTRGHLFALWGPAVGENRIESELFAFAPFLLKEDQPISARATILAGSAGHAVDMIKACLELQPLPELVSLPDGLPGAINLLAHGWLDSACRKGNQWRHAVWFDNFPPGYAADPPMYMEWLAENTTDSSLAERLQSRSRSALEELRIHQPLMNGLVSHVRLPAPPLLFSNPSEFAAAAREQAENLLEGFDDNGVLAYQSRPDKPDYGRTHFADHANGLSASRLFQALLGAAFSGDDTLIDAAVKVLDKQTQLYYGSVPRGAQTWEMPLHTPDILASAYLIRCYMLGYELTGNPHYLEQAEYWAWTGVPFIYLENPTEGEVGAYATIAVLGATNWEAPVWFGQPVQWCGLVYSSALFDLAAYRPNGPWETIAKGIARTGLRMSFPLSDPERQGLLPDFYHLRAQAPDGPAINPGTVQGNLPGVFDMPPLFSLKRAPGARAIIIAPCGIEILEDTPERMNMALRGWKSVDYSILLTRISKPPASVKMRLADQEIVQQDLPFDFQPDQQNLVLQLPDECDVMIEW